MSLDRRRFLAYFSASGLSGTLLSGTLWGRLEDGQPLTIETIEAAERLAGLSFTPEQRAMMVEGLNDRLSTYEDLRSVPLPNDVPPAFYFDPIAVAGERAPLTDGGRSSFQVPARVAASEGDDLAYLPVLQLASLIRNRQISCEELALFFLDRLKRYDSVLHTVITYTEDRAVAKARRLDEELDQGVWRGPLHGIPYGAKDLLAVRGYPTTWGATPFRDQTIDTDAAVVESLDAAGAVLIAKLSLGALAWGDVWFDAVTRNPWN
ncbi:MAG: amidase family protein, partial [Rhodothermales bacterium]